MSLIKRKRSLGAKREKSARTVLNTTPHSARHDRLHAIILTMANNTTTTTNNNNIIITAVTLQFALSILESTS